MDKSHDRPLWAEAQASRLETQDLSSRQIDRTGIVDELLALAERERDRAHASAVAGLAALAKIEFCFPRDDRRRWIVELHHAQFGLRDIGPTLSRELADDWTSVWREAIRLATPDAFSSDPGGVARFPDTPPFTLQDVTTRTPD